MIILLAVSVTVLIILAIHLAAHVNYIKAENVRLRGEVLELEAENERLLEALHSLRRDAILHAQLVMMVRGLIQEVSQRMPHDDESKESLSTIGFALPYLWPSPVNPDPFLISRVTEQYKLVESVAHRHGSLLSKDNHGAAVDAIRIAGSIVRAAAV
jgi:hypothetical protein